MNRPTVYAVIHSSPIFVYLEHGDLNKRNVDRLVPFAPRVSLTGLVVGFVPELLSLVSNLKDIDG